MSKTIKVISLASLSLLILTACTAPASEPTPEPDTEVVPQVEVSEPEVTEMPTQVVKSALYEITIPVPEGYTLENADGDYEFILTNGDATQFYFASDYSPTIPEGTPSTTEQITTEDAQELMITTYSFDDPSRKLAYVESPFDPNFYFSVSYDVADADKVTEVIRNVIFDPVN